MDDHIRNRLLRGAAQYAEADKSDPFALRRAIAHINSGIATPYNQQGEEGFYNAEPFQEGRLLPDGTEYQATVWRNRQRP